MGEFVTFYRNIFQICPILWANFISPVFLDNRTEVQLTVVLMLLDQILDVEILHPPHVPDAVTLAEDLDAGVHDVPEEGADVPLLCGGVELVVEGGGALGELCLHLLGSGQGAARSLETQAGAENHRHEEAREEAHVCVWRRDSVP